MNYLNWKINTRIGREVAIREISSMKDAQMTLIFCPEIGRSLSYYDNLLTYLSQQGITVITFNDAKPEKEKNSSNRGSIYDWATQGLDTIILFARQRYPQNELFLFAHGLSAQFIGFSPASYFIQKMVFLDSSLTSRSVYDWVKLSYIQLLMSYHRINAFFHPSQEALIIKRGVISTLTKWSTKPNGLFDIYPDNNFRKLKASILGLYSSKRNFHSTKKLLACFPSASIHYKNIKKTTAHSLPESTNAKSFLSPHLYQEILHFLQE